MSLRAALLVLAAKQSPTQQGGLLRTKNTPALAVGARESVLAKTYPYYVVRNIS